MRLLSLSFLGLFLSSAVSLAQPKVDPTNSELDGYLLRWEEEIQKMKSFAAKCGWTEKSPITGTDTYKGTLHFLRPDRFLLHVNKIDPVTKEPDPNDYQRVLSTGTYIYQYVPAQKIINVYKGFGGGQGRQHTAMELFFNMKAAKVKDRFDLKLAKTDKNYVYIDVFPKSPADKAEFVQARLVLLKSTMVPRQLWFKTSVNQEQVLWDIPALQPNVQIKPFETPTPPKGWKMVKQNPQPAARKGPVIRNQDR